MLLLHLLQRTSNGNAVSRTITAPKEKYPHVCMMFPFINGINVNILSPKIAQNILFSSAFLHEITPNPELDCGSFNHS